MQSYLAVNNYNPTFGIQVSPDFVTSAHNYFIKTVKQPGRIEKFDEMVKKLTI